MSKKICRTCLKMTYKTYKTHENIHYPGETEQLKISDMLRYLVPELYLGVTVNPEICEGCKKTLRVAYAFRKQCIATENVIGCYLKKSRCTASSIELIDVILFWEQKRKEARLKNQNENKAKEIISEWDDDTSQDSEQPNLSVKEKAQITPTKEKELTLCPELGVFVDKFGNYYDADGLSISDPEPIINTDSDFLKITEVFSLTDEGEPVPKIQKVEPAPKTRKGEPVPETQNTPSTEEQSTGSDKDKNVFRIRVIPEAKNSFDEPCISVIPEAKTDLMEARKHKMIKARKKRIYTHLTAIEEAKRRKAEVVPVSKPPISNTPEDSKQPVAPILPIIVDVRSECESVELCSPFINTKSHSEKAETTTEEKTVVKEEPMEHESHDDEETLTGSETNSTFDSIQGIIDNVPEDTYVDVPEFVHISNFSLKDLDELRKKQKSKQADAASVHFPQFSPSSGSTLVSKKLLKLLPKPESGTIQASTSGGEIQEIPTNTTQPEHLANKGIFKRHFKNCVVPKCPNNTDLNPQKIYVVFPKKETRRLQWFKAIGIEPLTSSEIYICEDHFDFSVDMENWEHFKVFGGIMRMKETVIPHSYLREIIPHERIYKSQIDEIEKKRRAEQIERLEKIKIRKSCDSDGPVSLEYQGNANLSATNGNKKSSVTDVQNRNDGDCPPALPALFNPSEPQLEQSLIDQVTEQAMEAYKNFHNDDKAKPRIIRKKGRAVKLVPVDANVPEKKNSSGSDVCVLFTNYTPTGLYINDHDYLVTPYKRNKILINQNNEWLCICFLCGSKHYAEDHVHHMNLHSSTCNVCKANLGTPFMLNMHVRFHSKKCKYCTEKVLYRDLLEHEMMHVKEEAEFDSFKKKKISRRKRKISYKDEEPTPISSHNESEENVKTSSCVEFTQTCAKQVQEVEKVTAIPQEQEEPIQIIPESQQTNNLEECKEILPEKIEPSAVEAVSKSNNIEESKVILPQKTEPSADNTVVAVPKMESNDSTEDNMKSNLDQPKNTPKQRNKKTTIKNESTPPNINDERKTRKKKRSREVEPVEIDESSPRILRSRQIKVIKEEHLSPVPDNNSSC